ncbi:hypothetical protein KM043_010727 [Ampulex compressa]|nr:hypothetical protein KM043_010727 [Ampulex compressa]
MRTMKKDEQSNEEPIFTIKDNVLRGKIEPLTYDRANVGELVLNSMKSHGERVGQIDASTDAEDTFADMTDRAIKCALWLKKQGLKPGDVVASSSRHNHLDTFVPYIATLCVGGIFTAWDADMNIEAARRLQNLSQPKIIFANEKSIGVVIEATKDSAPETRYVVFGEHPGVVSFAQVLEGHRRADVEGFRCAKIEDLSTTATIIYSSGTTGLPKGVQMSHYSLLLNIQGKVFDPPGEVVLCFSPLFWTTGMVLTIKWLYSGTKRIIFPYFDEEITCKLIEKYKVTWMLLSTSMSNRIAKSGFVSKYNVSSVEVLFTTGAIMMREAQEKLGNCFPNATVSQTYGMAELGGPATFHARGGTIGSCCVPVRNCEIKIIDRETGKLLGPNKEGEVCIRVPTITTGYYKNPVATKNTIDDEGFLHSGDLGYYNENGEIFVVGRLQEIIRYRKDRVLPSEIESILQKHPDVLEVGVIGVQHPTDDEHPMAFISTVPGSKVTAQELMDLVANNLMDRCKLRGGVKLLESLPHTPTAKIDKKELRAMAKSLAARCDDPSS